MTDIVQRQDRFSVVAYDGLDPLTGNERRRFTTPAAHQVIWSRPRVRMSRQT